MPTGHNHSLNWSNKNVWFMLEFLMSFYTGFENCGASMNVVSIYVVLYSHEMDCCGITDEFHIKYRRQRPKVSCICLVIILKGVTLCYFPISTMWFAFQSYINPS